MYRQSKEQKSSRTGGPAVEVSVVIAAYNYGRFVGQAVESCLKQTLPPKEVIVVDDGSIDNTAEVLAAFGDRIRNVRIPNGGHSNAKNHGASLATGALIAFLDADDFWEAEKLALQVPLFSDPKVGVVFSDRSWVDPNGTKLAVSDKRPLARGDVLDRLFFDNFICFSSAVIRADLWREIGGMDGRVVMGPDYDLWLRCAARCRFDYVARPLVNYRYGHGNMSADKNRVFESALRLMDRFVGSPDGSKLSAVVVRKAYADTYANWAYTLRSSSYRAALEKYLLSLRFKPWYWKSLKGLAWLHLVRPMRRFPPKADAA